MPTHFLRYVARGALALLLAGCDPGANSPAGADQRPVDVSVKDVPKENLPRAAEPPPGDRASRGPIPARGTDTGLARGIKVEASVKQSSFKAGEPIVISVRAENLSGRAVYVTGARSIYQKMTLQVFNWEEKGIAKTRFGLDYGLTPLSDANERMLFEPGGVITGELVANLACDMTAGQEYQIVVGLLFGESEIGYLAETRHAHSEIIKVKVTAEPVVSDKPRYDTTP